LIYPKARQYFLPEVGKFLGVIHKCEGGAGDACVAETVVNQG